MGGVICALGLVKQMRAMSNSSVGAIVWFVPKEKYNVLVAYVSATYVNTFQKVEESIKGSTSFVLSTFMAITLPLANPSKVCSLSLLNFCTEGYLCPQRLEGRNGICYTNPGRSGVTINHSYQSLEESRANDMTKVIDSAGRTLHFLSSSTSSWSIIASKLVIPGGCFRLRFSKILRRSVSIPVQAAT